MNYYAILDREGLADISSLQRKVAQTEVNRLEQVLREHADLRKRVTLSETRPASLNILPDSWSDTASEALIRHLALYADRMLLHDPLLLLPSRLQQLTIIAPLESQDRDSKFRDEVLSALRFVVSVRPLVDAEIISFEPTYFLWDDPLPGTITEADLFTPEGRSGKDPLLDVPHTDALLTFLDEHITYGSVHPISGEPIPLTDGKLLPSRGIFLQFEGDPQGITRLFVEFIPNSIDEKTRIIQSVLDPNIPLEPAVFANWLKAEAHKYAARRVVRLATDLHVAARTGARYLTSLPVSRGLIPLIYGKGTSEDTRVGQLLQLELPYFDLASMASLASARANEESFHEFRTKLTTALAELSQLEEGPGMSVRRAEIVRDLTTTPLAAVVRASERLQRSVLATAGYSLGTLGAFVMGTSGGAPGAGIVAGIVGLMGAIKTLEAAGDRLDDRRSMPGYFYWNAVGRPRRSKP